MPEGDTVWNTARVLDGALGGSVLRQSDFRVPQLATLDLARWRVRIMNPAGTVLTAMMMLIQLFATSQRAGGLLTNVVLFPMLMIGGAFFPFEAMPAWMSAIGKKTPNGWALEQLKSLLAGKGDATSIALAFALLLAVGAVLTALCSHRLRHGFAQAA
jgi:ABC-type multidrug transport system permease subunit